MQISEELRDELDLALEEALFLGVEADSRQRVVATTLSVLRLPQADQVPDDNRNRVQVLFREVSRVAAWLRHARWDDLTADTVPFEIQDLLPVSGKLAGISIYTGRYFNIEESMIHWLPNRASFDWRSGDEPSQHTCTLGIHGPDRSLDIRIWFEDLIVRDPAQQVIALPDFIEDAKRWWDAFNAGDPRTEGSGLYRIDN